MRVRVLATFGSIILAGCKPERSENSGSSLADQSAVKQVAKDNDVVPPAANAEISLPVIPPDAQGIASNDGTYFVSYLPQPYPIPLNEMFELTVWVAAPKEKTKVPGDIQLQVDAAMPEHDHGMNTKPKVTANADGSFKVSGMLLHMPGHWELYFDVTRAGITERAQFDVELE